MLLQPYCAISALRSGSHKIKLHGSLAVEAVFFVAPLFNVIHQNGRNDVISCASSFERVRCDRLGSVGCDAP